MILFINGSPNKDGNTARLARELIGDRPYEQLNLAEHKVYGYGQNYGDDDFEDVLARIEAADTLVVGSPVYYAAPNGALCAFLDRLFYMKSGAYAYKPAAAVVSCRRAGSTAALDQLNKYFTIAHMPIVSSQYWNSVHGNTPEEVRQDKEGLQIMRTLGDNMAWLLKCIEAAKGTVPYPVREPWTPTNFIR